MNGPRRPRGGAARPAEDALLPPGPVWLVDPALQVPGYDAALAAALAEAGAETRWLGGPPIHYGLPAGAPPLELAFGSALTSTAARRLGLDRRRLARRALRAVDYPLAWRRLAAAEAAPAVLHLQWSLVPALERASLARLRRRGAALVLTVHNVLPHERRPGQADRLRRLYEAVDGTIVHSHAAADALRALAPGLAAAPRVIPMPAFRPTRGPDRASARRRLGLPAEPLALFLGQIRPYKGLDDLLAAWPRVRARRPDARLAVVGALPGGAPARRRLAARTAGLPGLDLRPGYLGQTDFEAWLAAADVVVLPYRATWDSAVLAAARGAGRACLVTDAGGLAEAAARGGARVTARRDPVALAEALGALLDDPAARAALETEARDASEAWTWADAARETLDAYRAARARFEASRAASRSASPRTTALPTTAPPPPPPTAPAASLEAGAAVVAAPRASEVRAVAAASPSVSLGAPLVSVLVPARDAGATIGRTLDALATGTWPVSRLEVIVADGRSADDTRARVAARAAVFGRHEDGVPRLRCVDNPDGGTPAGLNAALAESRGDPVLRMDAHAVPAPDYVAACVDALARSGAWAVGGAMEAWGDTDFGEAAAQAARSLVGSGGAAWRRGRGGPADTVYLGAWPRQVLLGLGGFDERQWRTQDAELCERIRAAGGTVRLAPGIHSRTLARGGPRALARQYHDYGRGRAAVWLRHPRSLRARQALPAALVAALALLAPAAFVLRVARRALVWLSVAYGMVLVAGVLEARGRERVPARPGLVALALTIMHGAWGLGFWRGLAEAGRPRIAGARDGSGGRGGEPRPRRVAEIASVPAPKGPPSQAQREGPSEARGPETGS